MVTNIDTSVPACIYCCRLVEDTHKVKEAFVFVVSATDSLRMQGIKLLSSLHKVKTRKRPHTNISYIMFWKDYLHT